DLARATARHLGARHETFSMSLADLDALLPDLIATLETWDPLTLQIAASAHFLGSRIAGRHPILLSGYGADLLYGGTLDPSFSEAAVDAECRRLIDLVVPTNEFTPAVGTRWDTMV